MGGKTTVDAPDFTPVEEGLQRSAGESFREAAAALQRAQQRWEEMQSVLQPVLDLQLPEMERQFQFGRELYDRYGETYLPIEQQLINDYLSYASPARRSQEMGRAASDVSRAFEQQRENAQRVLESYGVDPSQTRQSALDLGMRADQAAAQAAAGTDASRYVDDVKRQLRANAINLGRTSLPLASDALGIGSKLGAGSLGLLADTALTGENLYQSALPWYQSGQQGLLGYGNALNTGFDARMRAAERKDAFKSFLPGLAAGAARGALMTPGAPWAGAAVGALGGTLGGTPTAGTAAPSSGFTNFNNFTPDYTPDTWFPTNRYSSALSY